MIVTILVLIIIALIIALALCSSSGGSGDNSGGGGSGEPGEGSFGRFRLLNGQRKKRLTNLELFRRVGGTWDQVDDDLKRNDDAPIVCQNIPPGRYFTANVGIDGNLLGSVQGLKVRWQTEHSNKWHEVMWSETHPAFSSGSGQTIGYVLVDIDSGRRGAGTVSLLMASGKRLLKAHSEGLGRVEVVNETGTALALFEIECTMGGASVPVHSFLANDDHGDAAALAAQRFYTGHVSDHRHGAAEVLAFHAPEALTVRWQLSGHGLKTATFPAGAAPFNGVPANGDHEVQGIRVTITGSDGSGNATLLMAQTRQAHTQPGV